jgi:DNA-binding NarL/FixJ family response regulator
VLKNLKVASCGVKVKQKNGKEMRMLLRYSPLEVFENDTVKIAAVSVDDITHLMRSEAYWLRIETGENKENVNHLISTDKKNQQQDIISPREKDVLRLIAQGMESKEIAEKLFISIYTVDNHRRNMIARTGVRDSTALIQICRMTGII